jgi:hypothetical protein
MITRKGLGMTLAAAIASTASFVAPALGGSGIVIDPDWSIARIWNEELLQCIRFATPRPPVHARNLYHASVATYDAWAAYELEPAQVLHHEKVNLKKVKNLEAARAETISFAVYRILKARFVNVLPQNVPNGPNVPVIQSNLDSLMDELGYDKTFTSTKGNSPAALGNRIAATILAYGLTDGANEAGGYVPPGGYTAINAPLVFEVYGVGTVLGESTVNDINRWQPLAFDFLVLQNGEVVGATIQSNIGPHWEGVRPFALSSQDHDGTLYFNPGAPPQLGGVGHQEVVDAHVDVIANSRDLDPTLGTLIDIGPFSHHNNALGEDSGTGYGINPVTGEPYEPVMVNSGDYYRVLAEFWADGPNSETPPGHWNVVANTELSDSPLLEKRIGGVGPIVDDLEWDVKLYLALNGATHDAAIGAWGAKGEFDGNRPITVIRWMGAENGQSSDPKLPSYHPNGLPLVPGLIELITEETAAEGGIHAHLTEQLFDIDGFPILDKEGNFVYDNHVDDIAIYCWQGQPENPDTELGGTGWILAGRWMPFQSANFVTPPFPGYVSGHSCYSRSSAELLSRFTGSEYFPGGIAHHTEPAGSLDFELGPTTDVTLTWAKFYDAADEAAISRRYGGIHAWYDDFPSRVLGSKIGPNAWSKAQAYFQGLTNLPDINQDDIVDGADLGSLLLQWGDCEGNCSGCTGLCNADINGDGVVDGADLGILLLNWTL